MTEITELIDNIRLGGGTLTVKGGKLLFTAAVGMSKDTKAALLGTLKTHKAALLAHFEAENVLQDRFAVKHAPSAPCGVLGCAGCYSVAPGVNLHPPRGAYKNEEVWR